MFGRIFDGISLHVKDLPADHPIRMVGENAGAMFNHLVETLRNPETFPDQSINKLLSLTWRLVGNDVIKVAVVPLVPRLAFGGSLRSDLRLFAIPEDWIMQCVKDRVMAMGGVVWASSQCRDAWNGKRIMSEVLMRADAYESQFLHVMKQHQGFTANEHQRKVMELYPQGVDTVKHLLYPRKAFMDAS